MSPTVLELRIHGVNNTPPNEMLALPDYAVEQVRGDRFGSFWRGGERYLAEKVEGDPAHVPARVQREAYSWGGMARTSPGAPGTGVPSVVLNVIGRIGWALLLPFGLTNVAYWSREIPARKPEERWRSGKGAGSTRLFGLGLTVLLVLAVCEVSISLLAVQCAPADMCTNLPGMFRTFGTGDRVLRASLIPVALLLGLLLLTSLSRCRYEESTNRAMRDQPGDTLLGDPNLWRGATNIRELTRVHLAVGFMVVVLAASQVLAITLAALVIVAVGCWMVARRTPTGSHLKGPDQPDQKDSWILLSLAITLLIGHGVYLYVAKPVLSDPLWTTRWAPVFVTGALAGLVLWALTWRPRSEWAAWHGMGPGVLLGLALTSALVLNTVLVLTTSEWLAGDQAVSPVHVWFSVSFSVALMVLVLVVLWLLGQLGLRVFKPRELDAATGPDKTAALTRVRHIAALAHRPEKIVGILSALGVLSALGAVAGAIVRPQWWIADQGIVLTAAAGIAVVTAFVGGGLLGNKRPLGLVWDLICFLPRTAHPFAPPCYAERAVPELVARTREWLDQDKANRVVLSAHSLGAVLAMATLFALPDGYRGRIRLLTYGSQLRTYFGRFFPELLGGDVLGIPKIRAGRLFRRDPWQLSDVPSANGGPPVPWINLWRRTDFLGFPVLGYATNDVDRPATETNGDRVQTHSDYHKCSAYRQAFDDLSPLDTRD